MKRRNVIKKDVLENYISQGHTDTEIAELVGVTQPAIYAARKRFGLEREVKNAKKRKYDIDLIADLAEKGYTRDEIMLLTGISKASLVAVNETEIFCESTNTLSFNVYKYSTSVNPMIGVVRMKNLP